MPDSGREKSEDIQLESAGELPTIVAPEVIKEDVDKTVGYAEGEEGVAQKVSLFFCIELMCSSADSQAKNGEIMADYHRHCLLCRCVTFHKPSLLTLHEVSLT